MARATEETKTENGAEIAARVIKDLEQRFGVVRPSTLVREAAKPTHPLHDQFEWDDKKAGHQYRINQARQLIASVKVVMTFSHMKIDGRAYYRDPSLSSGEQGYVSVVKLRTEKERAEQSLRMAMDRVKVSVNSARELAHSLDMMSQFHQFLESIYREASS